MKYGIIFFQNTENIGDDIQTYAAIQYLPKIDYVIEREKMSVFQSKYNEIVSVIMNGWFIHNPKAFPPSPVINPLIISTHFTNYLRKDELPRYLDDGPTGGLKYLKDHEPIGLRDNLISSLLTKAGIKNFQSGCLTTTIQKFKEVDKKNIITAVDIDDESFDDLNKISNCTIERESHTLNSKENAKLSFDTRMKNVERLLKKYQESKLVITSRLHCLLPCLALNTQVILIYNDKDQDVKNRLGDYLEFVNYFTKKEFLNIENLEQQEYNNKQPEKFLEMQNKLKKCCNDFIQNASIQKEQNLDLKEYFENLLDRNDEISKKKKKELDNYYKRILKEEEEHLNNEINVLLKETKKLTKENKKAKLDISDLKSQNMTLKAKNKSLTSNIDHLNIQIEKLREDSKKLQNIEGLKYYKIVMRPYFAYEKIKKSEK